MNATAVETNQHLSVGEVVYAIAVDEAGADLGFEVSGKVITTCRCENAGAWCFYTMDFGDRVCEVYAQELRAEGEVI